MVKDNPEREAIDIEDSTIDFLEDLLIGSTVLEGDEMRVAGNAVHNDNDRCIAIRCVKGTGEVYGFALVGLIEVRQGKGSSIG